MSTIIARGKKQWHKAWQAVTLIPLVTSTADVVGDIYYVGDYDNLTVIFVADNAATAANDILAVILDGSWDGSTFYNMGRFTDVAGDAGAASQEMMQFRKGGVSVDEDAILVLTAACAATVVRPSMCPPFLRVTYTITDGGGADSSHDVLVTAYVQ